MSLLQTLELTMFADSVRSTAIVVGDVTHTIPLETILSCPRNSRLSNMILDYCTLRDENPENAFKIFAKRNGYLFPHILHYANTGQLTYPVDIELTKTMVKDLCQYGLIRIKEGYCHQCLMEYFKLHGLDEFSEEGSSDSTDREGKNFPFLHLSPETLIVRTQVIGGEIFSIRAWGTPKVLDELFPKRKIENDATFFQLSMSVIIIHTDLCEFLKEIADTICNVVKKLGFRVTCFSTWSDESRVVTTGQWLLFREVPSVKPDVENGMKKSSSFLTSSMSSKPKPIPAKTKRRRFCPCFGRREAEVIPMEYPDLPSKENDEKIPLPN